MDGPGAHSLLRDSVVRPVEAKEKGTRKAHEADGQRVDFREVVL